MRTINYLNPMNPIEDCGCLGEICFSEKKLWKLSLLCGYDWISGVLTSRGLSFSNIMKVNEGFDRCCAYCDEHGIKYRVELSQQHWQRLIIVSQSAKNLAIIDKLYDELYYKNN